MTLASPGASPRVLLIGATSAISQAVGRQYAQRHARLVLVGRRLDALQAHAADLRVRGAADVEVIQLDANELPAHADALAQAWQRFGGLDVALIAHGTLPDQAAAQQSVDLTLACLHTNAVSVIALLTPLANRFEQQGAGVIGVISSPAADRGRASNYVYGAAKAAVSNFASGLRHRLAQHGVRVVTILPGFVDTPMTAAFPKGPLWAQPEKVAADIVRALDRNNGDLYTPWFWAWIMRLVRHLPTALFLRTKL